MKNEEREGRSRERKTHKKGWKERLKGFTSAIKSTIEDI